MGPHTVNPPSPHPTPPHHTPPRPAPPQTSRPDFAEYFSGNKLLPGADPAAHCYCGHQVRVLPRQWQYFAGALDLC